MIKSKKWVAKIKKKKAVKKVTIINFPKNVSKRKILPKTKERRNKNFKKTKIKFSKKSNLKKGIVKNKIFKKIKPLKKIQKKKRKEVFVKVELGKKLKYETDLDVLLRWVKDKKKVRLPDVANKFKISREKAEEWGQILSEHDLLRIDYPTFGEPVFVIESEKKEIEKPVKEEILEKSTLRKKVVINIAIISILIVGIVVFLIIKPFGQPSMREQVQQEVAQEENFIEEAFSGSGSFVCNYTKDDVKMTYWIKDENMRVESLIGDTSSTTIIKEGYMYTYIESEDKWIRVVVPETTIVPGSGKLLSIPLVCQKSIIDDNKFSISEEKIEVR